jgi:hypothetical protein
MMQGKEPETPGGDQSDLDPTPAADDGVDVSLIRWMLSLTPRERLQVLQQNVNSILKLRHAKRND